MSDYDFRNKTFDYTPPTRSGGAGGALILVAGIIILFLLGIMFMGSGTEPAATADPAGAEAVGTVPAPTAGQ